jgi:arabinogalactan oligomer/maltooligosaccharide transport system permease protein
LLFTPTVYKKIVGLITLGDPHPELPIKQRDHSMFMMIDGILILAVVFIFILLYYLSVQNALSITKIIAPLASKRKIRISLPNGK